ncbi:anthranilate synthase component II [Halocatena halophila]|uniref:anthranilate synthase component II n=1 Tax=Halocatena halophila TaxID=2814576 RepID=UPI002ED127BD
MRDEPTICVIDNFDSFTYNLVEYCSEHADVAVVRNTTSLEQLRSIDPDGIVISPGPGHPKNERDVGVTIPVLEELSPTVPTLGICLGLEAAVYAYGGSIDHAPAPVHGKSAQIDHDSKGVFDGLESPIRGGRYHSLVASSVPDCFDVSATTAAEINDTELVMGVRHETYPLAGVQFHPESVLSSGGHQLIRNFLTRL